MLSVVIPTLNGGRTLDRTLAALVPGAVDGLVKEVVVADGGSTDETLAIADAAGCRTVAAERGRGTQLAAGAAAARADWLLFLHADTVLDEGWEAEVAAFIASGDVERAATFRYALDDTRLRARVLETIVALRCAAIALPYGDQGLIISRRLYRAIGGFGAMPLMEDVDIVRRIGRRRLTVLRHAAVTSAERYRREGFARRTLRNLACVTMFYLHVPPKVILRFYG
jgi:rSAM/selenodomain-associated transferase 2